VVRTTNSIESLSRWLDALLPENPNMHLMYYGDAETTRKVIELREENIAKGLPSVMLITQGKSGSISVGNIFNSGFNLPSFAYSFGEYKVIPSWINDFARGGSCYTTHLTPSEENIELIKASGIQKIIVHVRDPRQAIISMIHHRQSYPEQAPEISGSDFREKDISDQLQTVSNNYTDYIDWITGWVNASTRIPIHFSMFNNLANEPEKFVQGYVDFYGVSPQHFSLQDAITQHAGTDYHMRKGATDEWREVMPEKWQKLFSLMLPGHIKQKFNWPD